MGRRNCIVPIVVRLRGMPDDDRLTETGDALARAVAGRLVEANRVIQAREGRGAWRKTYAAPSIRFTGAPLDDDLKRRIIETIEAGIAQAIAGTGAAARRTGAPGFLLADYHPPTTAPTASPVRRSSPRRRRRPARGWRVLLARDFYTTVGEYAEFVDTAEESRTDLGNLYLSIAGEQRRVALWLVQVDRAYRRRDLSNELSNRAIELASARSHQNVAWSIGVAESSRKKLMRIDHSGTVAQTIPDLTANLSHLSAIRGEVYVSAGGLLFLTTMILPRMRLEDYLQVEPEVVFSLRYRDLEFLINPAGFESVFKVSWPDFLAIYGDTETKLHVLQMQVLQTTPWETVDALMERATHVREGQADARNWWRLEPLNRSFVDALPDQVRQIAASYTDSQTLALDASDRWGPWHLGWRAAMVWANFQVNADQHFAASSRAVVGQIADRLIAHLGAFKENDLGWWFELGHILNENFKPYTAPEGVRTLFDLVMQALEARESGRWFKFLLDTLDTSEGNETRAFLQLAFVSTIYSTHPRIVAMLNRNNASWRRALRNEYLPATNSLRLDHRDDRHVSQNGVLADQYGDYSWDESGQMLIESRRDAFEKAMDAQAGLLVGEIVKGTTKKDYDVTEFTNEVVKRAALSIGLKNDDFEKVTITYSARVTKVKLIPVQGLQHYLITWNLVKRIDDQPPWEDVPDTERESTDLEFEFMLWGWQFARNGHRFEVAGLIIAGIGVAAVAWEVGAVAALVELAGGTATVLSSIVLSEIITLVWHKIQGKKFTLEDFVWAAIDGYINALTFRFAGLGGAAIAGRIGTATMTNIVEGALAKALFTGVVGGAAGGALTTFTHGLAGVLLGNSTFPTFGDFVRSMTMGALMGLAGEFVLGPALQGVFRLGSKTVLATVAEAAKLIGDNGISPAAYAAQVGEALGALSRQLGKFLSEGSVREIMTVLSDRFAELGAAIRGLPAAAGRRLDLALFRRVFEVAEIGLGRVETDGLERLLAATEAGAAAMSRDELLSFLNGLASNRAQAARVLQGLGRLAEERVAALIAGRQLEIFAGADHLLSHLLGRDADLVWEVWNGGAFQFRTADFEAWLGRIAPHPEEQQQFGLEILRRPDQLITPEGITRALEKGGLSNDIVAGLDRLYGAFDDPSAADAIMKGVANTNAQSYLRFLAGLQQAGVNQLADQGLLPPLSNAPRVVALAAGGTPIEPLLRHYGNDVVRLDAVLEWTGTELSETETQALLTTVSPDAAAGLRNVGAARARGIVDTYGTGVINRAAPTAGGERLEVLRELLGDEGAKRVVERQTSTPDKLTALNQIADDIRAARSAVKTPLGALSVVLDNNAFIAIRKLMDATPWGDLQTGERDLINQIRELAGQPALTATPSALDLASIVGAVDLRASNIGFGELGSGSRITPGGLELTVPSRNSPEYVGVLNELERVPQVGGPKGAKDRSNIADTAFANTSGGTPRFVTNDPLVLERLARYSPTPGNLITGSTNLPLWERIIANVRRTGANGFPASIPDGLGGTHEIFVVPASSEE